MPSEHKSLCVWGAILEGKAHGFIEAMLQTPAPVVDGDDLSSKISSACNLLASEGYEVIAITPLAQGTHLNPGERYSPTTGAIITGRRA